MDAADRAQNSIAGMKVDTEFVRRFNTLGDLPPDTNVCVDPESSMIAIVLGGLMPGEQDDDVVWLDKWQAKRLAKMLLSVAETAGKP